MKKRVQHLISGFVLAGFLFMAFGSDDNKKEEETSVEATNKTINTTEKKLTDVEIKEQLDREISSIDKGIDFTSYKESIESIQLELVLFQVWAKKINEAKSSNNNGIKELGEKLETKVKKIQVSEFPKLRKAYGKIVAKKLWVENIEVEVFGNNSKTIQFTGGIFANNKNKQETQETLSEMLNFLRFKKVNYKWYEYDDEYTYYDLDSKNDNEIVELN
ncbi:hypothetical protein FLCU109888_11190 [Flavobacterium cucumis]|uniref:Lipoprotein n=1 Tax=Flavobacterium cucumis TaxID=416016 RepID=A0A1M7ZZH8_9FLAO|nr:hypothetical protein [Flavobacterium cucumis]SHO74269.1 hypothetical protein SAMN05443547_2659 [Flavobacterium cucumis]